MNELWQHVVVDFANIGTPAALAAFGQVVVIDVLLAADNAIVVGALAAGLPPAMRRRVILIGVAAALLLRVVFALLVTQLLQVTGLVFAGGLLLVWVAWKMWRELRADAGESGEPLAAAAPRRFWSAAGAVAVADVSMSLDNVLAVAGAARDHPGILAVGLILSVALMGLAANLLARVIERYRWLAYVGLLVILFVAGRMIWEGLSDPARGVLAALA
ncbi:YjbE family putative metal transport protein [Sphingomonas sp. HHU CXW]|uniref:YjbE family putative metal transport protein n=1 Tax=Sphingomonas hominis TaxID=2741495 RepID=A0ABX2JNK0_9SPHN|nr:YjbE family putative metal transport protein [Sphingomonas hominis]NTS65395.1 YjbE family putative metal transport protein [Sphingomonas hominis]